ncbi:MAG: tRNA pseudouridine(13) synthase TruD [Planctomycetia bacterium]|nr:tRNA pseudouridine(13) synthase TruD [Planctomycetia bacterium]
MKLKRRPEDFAVEELSDLSPAEGPFALYKLTKRSLGTPEAIDAVLRRWDVQRRRASFGGLKDKHALTTQFLTIHHGPRRNLTQTNLELVYLGQIPRPFTPADIRANRFSIVLRDLSPAAAAKGQEAARQIATHGVPNYFDEQRFGSLGKSGEFIALPWCKGDYKHALWLALADPNDHDRPEDRQQKELLREHWGNWPTLRSKLGKSAAGEIVARLVDRPTDFRGALARIDVDLRGLYLAAFQSFLWNKLLSEFLRSELPAETLFDVAIGPNVVAFYRTLPAERREPLLAAILPLPSARQKVPEGPLKELYDRVVTSAGLAAREIRVKYPRDSFFSRGQRSAICVPMNLQTAAADDDLYLDRRKLNVSFDLARGSYATIVVKRLTVTSPLAGEL